MRLVIAGSMLGASMLLALTAVADDELPARPPAQMAPGASAYVQPSGPGTVPTAATGGAAPCTVGRPFNGRPYGGGPGWQNPQIVSLRLHAQMNDIERDLRERVEQGTDRPEALNELHVRRRVVEQDIQNAAADGVITPQERMLIGEEISGMRGVEPRYRFGSLHDQY